MINIEEIDFTEAERYLAESNTPSYLARKLKGSSLISFISARSSGKETRDLLTSVLRKEPKNLRAAAIPYTLATVLYQQDRATLTGGFGGRKSIYYPWFNEVVSILISSPNASFSKVPLPSYVQKSSIVDTGVTYKHQILKGDDHEV